MKKLIERWLPRRDTLRGGWRWLPAWAARHLSHPQLWHISRRGIALGFAIGIFMGLLIPLAQIPVSTLIAIALRANVPIAVAATFVTNPFTFAPIYYFAYRIGGALIGNDDPHVTEQSLEREISGLLDWVGFWWEKVRALGKPLVAGLVVLASIGALVGYLLVSLAWRAQVALRRRRRQRRSPR